MRNYHLSVPKECLPRCANSPEMPKHNEQMLSLRL